MAYREVCFRIRTEAYVSERSSDADKAAFREESRRLFQELGWTLEPGCNGVCDTVTKGQQDLYLHPSVFSGVMEETNIPPLQEQLSKARTFHSFGFDCHEEYRNLSDEEYRAELEAKRDEITSYILERCRTKRRNLYIVAPVATDVAAKFEICRLCDKDRRNRVGNRFVADLMDELLRKGWLVSAQTSCGEGIRTATNKERGARQPVTQVDGQITMGCQEKRPDPSPKRKKPPAPSR